MYFFVITTPTHVFATYAKTICCKKELGNTYDEKQEAITIAQATAFGYACSSVNAVCQQIDFDQPKTDEEIFEYLESRHGTKTTTTTTYIHNSTLAEFTVEKAGKKVVVLKCVKAGTSKIIKVGQTTKTSPAGLAVLYSQK